MAAADLQPAPSLGDVLALDCCVHPYATMDCISTDKPSPFFCYNMQGEGRLRDCTGFFLSHLLYTVQ
jgi:hypothetical protein